MFFKKIIYKIFKSKSEYSALKIDIATENQLNFFKHTCEPEIKKIDQSIKDKKELNFLHSGHCGDLIYSLPVIKKLSNTHKCNFYLGVNKKLNEYYHKHPGEGFFINEKMADLIFPLLKAQKFINNVNRYNAESIDINLDFFRELPISLNFNSPRWYFHITGQHLDLKEPYLHVEDHQKLKKQIVILRSFRYRNHFINYKFLYNYNDDLIFIGLKDEYDDLKKQVIKLKYYDPKDFLEMAKIIKSSRFFLGNQCLGFAIAEGLKIPRLLEQCPMFPVVQPVGNEAYDFYFQAHFEKWFEYLYRKFN